MRALPIAVVAAAAALTLAACDSGGDSSSDSGKKASTSSSAAASTACKIDQIGIQVGPANAAPAAGDTGNVPVTLTNKGAECTLQGFPAVTVQGGGKSTDVPEEKAPNPPKLTLAKSGTASFTITYVRGTAGDGKSLDATALKISLPGAATAQSFKWSYGPVAGKTGASDPNASVSSFQPAGD
jgi:hypothetical protein